MSNSGKDDWKRLGRVVAERRLELGWPSRDAFGRSIGISGKTIGKLEASSALAFSGRTLSAIERGLGWSKGSVNAVLQGEEPTPVDDATPGVDVLRSNVRAIRNAVVHGGGTEPTTEELWSAWVGLTHEMLVIEMVYASRRGLTLDQAQRELNSSLIAHQVRGRTEEWVPPWEEGESKPQGAAAHYLHDVGAAAYDGDPEVSDPDDEVHPS